jgi:hypothetical protein
MTMNLIFHFTNIYEQSHFHFSISIQHREFQLEKERCEEISDAFPKNANAAVRACRQQSMRRRCLGDMMGIDTIGLILETHTYTTTLHSLPASPQSEKECLYLYPLTYIAEVRH